jgi:hypothetical protein
MLAMATLLGIGLGGGTDVGARGVQGDRPALSAGCFCCAPGARPTGRDPLCGRCWATLLTTAGDCRRQPCRRQPCWRPSAAVVQSKSSVRSSTHTKMGAAGSHLKKPTVARQGPGRDNPAVLARSHFDHLPMPFRVPGHCIGSCLMPRASTARYSDATHSSVPLSDLHLPVFECAGL